MVGIGFFAPFPLALMVPFMAGQSLAMGEAFGKGFQYGKRKISSMSNEEFNALDFKGLAQSIATDYKDMIPSLEESIRASDRLQTAVFQELGDLIKSIPDEILRFFDTASGNTSGITQTAFTGSVGIPLGPKAGSPEDQFGVVAELAKKAVKKVLPGSLGGTISKKIPVQTQVIEKPTQAQSSTTISPTFANSLTAGDLNRGGHRTRNTRQGLIQWTGTHLILSRGINLWSVRLWKNNSWKEISFFSAVSPIAQINKIKRQMGSSYVLQIGKKYWLISDGHVAGFK